MRCSGRRILTARHRLSPLVLVPLLVFCALTAVAPPRAEARPGPLPTIIGSKLLGRSLAGRPITAYHLGDPHARIKAVALGQMHGDEHAGVIIANAILHGPPIKGIDLWVVPTMNPDGNRWSRRGNNHGVDLNRNWPDIWLPLTGAYDSGPRPLSEPETRAMYYFLGSVRPRFLVSLHQPLYGVDTTDGGARDPAFRNRLARNLGLPLKPFTCWWVCHGSMTGWLTTHQSGAAITVEYGSSPTATQLTRVAPRGIIAAMGGSYDSAAAHNPRGHIDLVGTTGSTVRFVGWGLDLDAPRSAITVRVLEGTAVRWQAATTRYRSDVNRVYRTTGYHGFDARFVAPYGRHAYCVQFLNVGPGSADPTLCYHLSVDGRPIGHLDAVTSPAAGSVQLTGWTVDPDAASTSGQVQVSVDGTVATTATTDVLRADVNTTYHAAGNHGFDVTLPSQPPGAHTYCVDALNLGPPGPSRRLGCVVVTIAAQQSAGQTSLKPSVGNSSSTSVPPSTAG